MGPKYFDIHTHVNFTVFDADRADVIQRAKNAGVTMINVGTQRDTSQIAIDIAEQYDHCFACVGLHPIHTGQSFHDKKETGEGGQTFISRGEIFDYGHYLALARHPKVLAIGETGLDYYHKETRISEEEDVENIRHQRETFLAHIRLADEVGKPLMIHARPSKGSMDAYDDVIDMLVSYKQEHGTVPHPNFHFFVGDIPTAQKILDIGGTVSFDGPITFSHDYNELIRFLPLSSIMVETDAPYATPKPHRGKTNEPSFVVYIAQAIATIRQEDEETVVRRLFENASRIFGPV
ncbi:MAG: TatD family hydrolase [Candidatus Pacebacteria bacterium]|nr:TatD family hydrolase [Candidatus Paceibacterota bacterium]